MKELSVIIAACLLGLGAVYCSESASPRRPVQSPGSESTWKALQSESLALAWKCDPTTRSAYLAITTVCGNSNRMNMSDRNQERTRCYQAVIAGLLRDPRCADEKE